MFEWWHWLVLGLCLSMAELLVPAFFIVWFGIGAIGVGVVLLFAPSFPCQRNCSCGQDCRRCSSPSGSGTSGRAR